MRAFRRVSAAVPSLFSLLSFLFYELGQAVTRHTKLQAAVPALFCFLFWQQCLLFSLVAVSPFSRLSCLQLAVLFSVQTLLRVPAAVRTESGRLAPKAGGHPPLSCFHAVTCGLRCLGISPASIMRTGPCYSRRMCADAVREDY